MKQNLDINGIPERSWKAFEKFRKVSLTERATFLRAIGAGLLAAEEELILLAHKETHLGEPRLKSELKRTIYQLSTYADACEKGSWLDIRINNPTITLKEGSVKTSAERTSSTAFDLRKMLVPLGPVVVFGASNFPFAYSTAGGDTACAFAAGCSVIVKAHPAHPGTSDKVAQIIQEAISVMGFSEDLFIHVHGGYETGKDLVLHPLVKAVGFTGSFEGGHALFDLANKRKVPIPVFAEMGSVNPVFLLPGKLGTDTASIVRLYARSITQGAGQFCTNPGILVGIEGKPLDEFRRMLGEDIQNEPPVPMLHQGIADRFLEKRKEALSEDSVNLVAVTERKPGKGESIPTLAEVAAPVFIDNPVLHKEVFGPFSLLVRCRNIDEMKAVAESLEGQLTCSLMANEDEVQENFDLVDILKERCGRLILNGVPTGVEVAQAMQHGGPFPATTDSRFTAVGADGLKRFARPVCFQNWPNALLPEELKNENPLGIWRTINDELSKSAISLNF